LVRKTDCLLRIVGNRLIVRGCDTILCVVAF